MSDWESPSFRRAMADSGRFPRTETRAPEPDESTATLIARFNHHADQVINGPASARVYHISVARGLHKLLADRAVNGDDEAGNAALGAPHWLTYSPEQMRTMR